MTSLLLLAALAALEPAPEPGIVGAALGQGPGFPVDGLFAEKSHDWGNVERGAQLTHQFTLQNNTGKELHIAETRVSCQCTSVMATTNTIPAGGSAILDVRMETVGFLGPKSVTVFVTFDKPRRATAELRVSAVSGGKMAASNAGSIDFGVVQSGAKVEKTLQIALPAPPDWHIRGVTVKSAAMQASFKELPRENGMAKVELALALMPNAPVGLLEEQVMLQTSDAKAPELVLTAKARVEAPFTLAPATLKLDNAAPGTEVSRNFMLKGPQAFRLTFVKNAAGLFEVKSGGAEKNSHLVVVKFTMPADLSKLPEHLELVTSVPGAPPVLLPVLKPAKK